LPNEATFRVFLNPFINWVWAGGLIFVTGTLIAAWPDPVEQRRDGSRAAAGGVRPALGGIRRCARYV
jgi:cytochrome c biogenesis factor